MDHSGMRLLASGATDLWAGNVRPGQRLDRLGEAVLEAERPFHVALSGADQTLCGSAVKHLRDYPIDFAAQEMRIRCPVCDERLGHPSPDE